MYDLNDLVLPGSGVSHIDIGGYANAINDLGQFAAFGIVNGEDRAILLAPVPEPGAATLLAFAALIASTRRSGSGSKRLRVKSDHVGFYVD